MQPQRRRVARVAAVGQLAVLVREFQAGWGVSPGVIDLNSESRWEQDAPVWAVGRHALVLARLREHSGHTVGVLADDDEHRWMAFVTR